MKNLTLVDTFVCDPGVHGRVGWTTVVHGRLIGLDHSGSLEGWLDHSGSREGWLDHSGSRDSRIVRHG